MTKETINPQELFNSLQYGFSQIVVSKGARRVHISGQVAWNAKGEIVGKGDLNVQTNQSLQNLRTAIELAGGRLQDIVALRIYIVQSVIGESTAIREGLQAFFPENPPAATWIGVTGLANEDFLIEIEAEAVMD